MSISLVGSLGAVVSGGLTTTPTFGQATSAGNLLVAWCFADNSNNTNAPTLTTTSSGWLQAVLSARIGTTVGIFYKPNCASGEANPAFSSFTGGTGIQAMLGEFSGAVSTPLDQVGSADGIASPLVATNAAADGSTGDLLVSCGGWLSSKAGTQTTADTYNNGATPTGNINVDALSQFIQYRFAWGVPTSNSVADQDSQSATGMNLLAGSLAVASFAPVPPSPSFTQQGALRNDPDSIQNIGQAVKRGAYFCLGEKWARRRSGLIAPAPGRDFVLA